MLAWWGQVWKSPLQMGGVGRRGRFVGSPSGLWARVESGMHRDG